jgi:hypothetical protein
VAPGWIDQDEPFHRSTRENKLSPAPFVPITVQALAELHDSAGPKPTDPVDTFVSSGAITDHVLPFQRMDD